MAKNARRLTIKGGVSLGAYEAGAITEILNVLEYNNSNSGTPELSKPLTPHAAPRAPTHRTQAGSLWSLSFGDASLMSVEDRSRSMPRARSLVAQRLATIKKQKVE
jgi:hypothetical protein